MSAWRRIAIEKLPQFRTTIENSESLGMLWIDLLLRFEDAHREPADDELIRGTYDFAWWTICTRNLDLSTQTVCVFYEHLPLNKRVRRLLPRYMTREQFNGLSDIFRYHLSPEQHAEFVEEFHRLRDQLDGKAPHRTQTRG